ncbi:MAG: iron-containing alcohol dehydrogenase [Polyangiaceae bacterium]|nr:iron-containing alcohol dehydrogenase [Polyangiaceae bacterium]
MACAHGLGEDLVREGCFSIDPASVVFGRGALAELGDHAAGLRRVMLVTDRALVRHGHVDVAVRSLRARGIDVVVFDEVSIEPTDASFTAASEAARGGGFDGYVSLGGGSAIDTAKAAALYATYPAPLETYVNAPLGLGRPVPGPLPRHIACPSTCGTGSECTGIAVFDWVSRHAKTGIASRALRPSLALVDPTLTASLPASVVAASGFDVLCHAIESTTARPFTSRARPSPATARPMSQGRNPWSDLGSQEALRIAAAHLVRAVTDASDTEAREALSWAALLAGIAFGNAGVHLPHAMSYAVSANARDFKMPGYPDAPLVPHGVAVVVNAPSVFRATAAACPERHLAAAAALGVDVRGASPGDAGHLLCDALTALMRATGVPVGLSTLGFTAADLPHLAPLALAQRRLVDNAPFAVTPDHMREMFQGALDA